MLSVVDRYCRVSVGVVCGWLAVMWLLVVLFLLLLVLVGVPVVVCGCCLLMTVVGRCLLVRVVLLVFVDAACRSRCLCSVLLIAVELSLLLLPCGGWCCLLFSAVCWCLCCLLLCVVCRCCLLLFGVACLPVVCGWWLLVFVVGCWCLMLCVDVRCWLPLFVGGYSCV